MEAEESVRWEEERDEMMLEEWRRWGSKEVESL